MAGAAPLHRQEFMSEANAVLIKEYAGRGRGALHLAEFACLTPNV
jgi:hypothetical protein